MHSYHATDRSGHALSASVAFLAINAHAAHGSAPKISDHSSAPEEFAARRKPRPARESICAVRVSRLGSVVGVRGFEGASRTTDHTIFNPDQQGGCSRESRELGRNCTADRVSPDERQMNVSGAISVLRKA